jgi:hypothetical protein
VAWMGSIFKFGVFIGFYLLRGVERKGVHRPVRKINIARGFGSLNASNASYIRVPSW